jgi:pimeloyl-ACP methyl ester carboxylesterase
MWRSLCTGIDEYRIWYKITFRRGRILATAPDAWKRYARASPFGEPRAFFPGDGRVPEVRLREEEGPAGVRVTRIEFPTLHPLPYPETNLAVGHLYAPAGRSAAPLVVLSHGWAHRSRRGIARLYVLPFVRRGYRVLLMAHPLHFERTPGGSYSGELMVSGDAALTVEAFRQAVADTGAAVNAVLAAERTPWGAFGYSLGGYVAGLLGCVRDDAAFLVLAGCGDSVISPILDTRLGRNVREDLAGCGMLDRTLLGTMWGTISPGRWKPALERDRILIVAGLHDRIMVPSSVRRLHEAWGRPEIRWLRRGHYTLLATPGALFREALPFLEQRTRSG